MEKETGGVKESRIKGENKGGAAAAAAVSGGLGGNKRSGGGLKGGGVMGTGESEADGEKKWKARREGGREGGKRLAG